MTQSVSAPQLVSFLLLRELIPFCFAAIATGAPPMLQLMAVTYRVVAALSLVLHSDVGRVHKRGCA